MRGITNRAAWALFARMAPLDDLPLALGRAVRERRSELGFSRAEAVRRWGVHPSWLRRLEEAESNPSLDRLRALADGMGIPLSALFRRAEQLDD